MSVEKHGNQEAINFLEEIKSRAIRDSIRRTEAINTLIDVFPDITRKECFWSAEAVGISGLTARNVWDHRRDERNGA